MATAVEGSSLAPAPEPSGTELPAVHYDDAIVRLFAGATVLWGALAMLGGVLIALLLVLPGLTYQLGPAGEFLTFGRLRPLHTNAGIFAFVGNAIFAAIYYSTQRLCRCRIWSGALARLHFWCWQGIILAAAATLPLGITQSKLYAELEWPIDVAIAIVWIGFFGVNFFMTLARRREPRLHVALWFYIATVITFSLLHVANNLVIPFEALKSYPLYAGARDALMQWWYGHNVIAFLLIVPFLGLMYYFVPAAARQPIYSYKLAIVHFWTLIFLVVLAGPHHVHYTAMPQWVGTIAMVFGLMVWMPYWGGMINGLLTLRGSWGQATADPVLKFFAAGIGFYALATLGGPLLGIRSFNALTHYSDWTIAHIHTGTLGWNGMMAFGMLYWMMPRLFQTPLWSVRMMTWHFWAAVIGILLYIVPIYAAGLTQGWMWHRLDDTGRLVYPDFLETIRTAIPYWWIRVVGGAVFLAGGVMLGLNFVMTWATRPAVYKEPVDPVAPAGSTGQAVRPAAVPSALADKPVLELAVRIDSWSQLDWHDRWEGSAGRMAWWSFLAVAIASAIVMIPMFVVRGNVPVVNSVRPYTPLELAGRDLYVSEGCYNCHSQMVRHLVAETIRFGDYSRGGESAYDQPAQWGTRRIGPDLARVGDRRSSYWHWLHLEDPRHEQVSPGSVMPSFEHLLGRELDFEKTTQRVRAAHRLGAPYDRELEEAPAMARRQAEEIGADIVKQGGPVKRGELMVMNTQAIALIAYLQRLGVDLNRPAEQPAPAAPHGAPAEAGDTQVEPAE